MLDRLRSAPPKTLEEAQRLINGLWEILSELESFTTELKAQNDELREQVWEQGEIDLFIQRF